jgi:Flp pilus assembly protein TadG
MAGLPGRIAASFRTFRDGTDGGVTVEFVMWVPVFLGVFLTLADVSMMYLRQSSLMSVSQDTARIVSRHGLDPEAAEVYARHEAQIGSYAPEVSVEVDESAATVTVTISAAATEIAPFGVFTYALGDMVTTQVTRSLEPI